MNPTGFSLSLLGAWQASLNGEPITPFESNKVRALLFYLAVEAEWRATGNSAWSDTTATVAKRPLFPAIPKPTINTTYSSLPTPQRQIAG